MRSSWYGRAPGRSQLPPCAELVAGAITVRPPREQVLPLTGFPFAQAGFVAVVLIGLGALVTWAGGRHRRS